jgi:pimeloyl-ACP methyl ester carboxylesterase
MHGGIVSSERVEFVPGEVTLVGDRYVSPRPHGVALLLHGGGQTRHSWSHTAKVLAERGWTTIALDARGHGESGWAESGDYTADAFVSDLRGVIATLEEAPVLIGASLGGLTSLLAEGEFGPLSRSLVLVDVVPRVERAGVERIFRFMRQHLDGFASLEEVAAAVQAYNPHRKRSGQLEGLKKNVRQRADGRWYWHWDPAMLSRPMDDASRATSTDRLLRAAARVRVPTLVVRGGESDVVSQHGVQELLDRLADGRAVDVQATGHMVAGDDNDAFTRAIDDHLRSLGGPSR